MVKSKCLMCSYASLSSWPLCSLSSFPPVRACIFDMDGLLINSEDAITDTLNELLEKYGRPLLTPEIRSRLMGVPGSSEGSVFHDWAQLPVSRERFAQESRQLMRSHFANCVPLPGAKELLSHLSRSRSTALGISIELAVASTTTTEAYNLKMTRPETKALLETFSSERRILGDDPRVPSGRKKPAPDLYIVALAAINSTRPPGTHEIKPNECIAIEDSVAGVEAARRAGMRVIWVPHPFIIDQYDDESTEAVLAGRSGMFSLGDELQLGEVGDGWGERVRSLYELNCDKYGIQPPDH